MKTKQSPAERAAIARLAAAFPAAEIEPALRARLIERAERAGVLDLAVRTVGSPFGELLLAASEAGLVRIAWEREGHDAVLARLAETISPRILRAPRRLDGAARQLDEYFAGRRRRFELPLDLRLAHGFRRTVLVHLQDVGYGTTASYARLAQAAGRPRAVRAAASACATNPIPLVVPCHRIVRSDGSVGEYLAGPATKRALLALEAS
jgi:methylated-DNA-[protein]-cysteine S-methyltransferase